MNYCGIDEAGRGSVMGPLVVAIVRTDSDGDLMSMGVKDSKKLTPHRREVLYEKIFGNYETEFLEVSAEEIDSLRKKMSLNEIELDMFAEAVGKLPSGLVYADCPDVNTSAFSSRLSRKCGNRFKIVAEHKADDKYPVVSAASIVAKVIRDRRIKEISEEFGESVGSGYPSDRVTMDFIERWIKEKGVPPPNTRCSWESVRNLTTLAANTKISDW
ncbi:MAG: ribonuclease HII [Candidatus Methanomethylophilaceae archaeon]